jgi:DNA-binding Xre family transcriptional regulator
MNLTAKQRAAFKAIRKRAEIDQPSLDELIERNEAEKFVSHGAFMELLTLVDAIRHERERRKLSLTEVAQRSGLTRAMVSKLENGRNPNPTLDTLARYALALDMQVKRSVEPVIINEAT